jgi:hypothetical protein
MAAARDDVQRNLAQRGAARSDGGQEREPVMRRRVARPHVQHQRHPGDHEAHALQRAQWTGQLAVPELIVEGDAEDAADAVERERVEGALHGVLRRADFRPPGCGAGLKRNRKPPGRSAAEKPSPQPPPS